MTHVTPIQDDDAGPGTGELVQSILGNLSTFRSAVEDGTYETADDLIADFWATFPWGKPDAHNVARLVRESAEYAEFMRHVDQWPAADDAAYWQFDLSDESLAVVEAFVEATDDDDPLLVQRTAEWVSKRRKF